MPMSSVSFSVSDVREEADKDPWDRRDEFSDEVNEEDMADDASRYSSAAEEARNAGELGEIASAEGGDAAEYNGAEIIDRAQRDDLTANDLGNNGDTMERVTGNILRAIAEAQNALDGADEHLETTETTVEELSESAEEIYDNFVSFLSEQTLNVPSGDSSGVVDDFVAQRSPANTTPQPPPVMVYDGTEYSASGSWSGGWYVPGNLTADIRRSHIDLAVDSLATAHGEIEDIIDQYRHNLGQLATELEADGYDTSGSSLELWNTEEMAVYNGEKLDEELLKDNPDPELLHQYTLGLNGAVNQLYDNDGNPLDDFSPEAAEHVSVFLDQLSEEALLALGELDGEIPETAYMRGDAPLTPVEQIAAAQRAVSNGIVASMDPTVGGINPDDIVFNDDGTVDTDKSPDLPVGVTEYVYNLPHDIRTQMTPQEGGEVRESLENFGAFGNLMGQATVSPGNGFASDLADTAVSIQEFVDNTNNTFEEANLGPDAAPLAHFEYLENSGSSGLLAAAANNEKVAAEKLADEDFADAIILSNWDDDAGAARFITSGTTLPDDVDPTSDQAAVFNEAAYNVLSTAGEKSGPNMQNDFLIGQRGNRLDESATPLLMGAIGDTMIEHMDTIVDSPDPTSGIMVASDGTHTFSLSAGETSGLFETMNRTDNEVRDAFHGDVAKWQYDTSLEAFESGDPGNSLSNVARSAAYMNNAVLSVADEGTVDAGNLRISTIVGVATLGAVVTGTPWAAIGTVGMGEVVRHTMPDFEPSTADLQEYMKQNGDVAYRHIIAEAAYQSGALDEESAERWENRDIPDEPVDITDFSDEDRDPSPVHRELRQNVESVEGSGGYDSDSLARDAYATIFDDEP